MRRRCSNTCGPTTPNLSVPRARASANADWVANKTITLPETTGITLSRSGTVTSGGSGGAFTVLNPAMLMTFYQKL
jgi:hypothetical protein